ncbi:amidase [Rhodoferax sp.]|uniref:amidase n=1 Tax=Rhodoferax sp. TaxID=50421 RepID=UPI0025E9A0B0|nr:amidase [Rhodoferax sp.]MCM2342297.1 amidase [Rhodoferax sp.]
MTSSTTRLEQALAAIEAVGDEGRRIFTHVYADQAREAAQAADARASRGIALSPIDGRIVSIKDLFDVAGETTTAGSALLRDSAPAAADAVVVQRLRSAGAVIVGKTNMTEFAFSGIGINPHYGTPGNAHDVTRIPGGSSSGAGVSVARGMAEIAIGSDTGGSVRIPSALNGLTGFKPSQSRVPRTGAFPLSFSLDTVGPLTRGVADCARADAVLSNQTWQPLPQRTVRGLRIGVPRGLLFSQTEDTVLEAFEAALLSFSAAGARIDDESLDEWLGAPFRLQERGTLVAAEAAYIHRATIDTRSTEYDPVVLGRIRRGMTLDAAGYVGIQQARAQLQPELDARLEDLDVLVLPTVPFVAPRIDALADETAFNQANGLVLRNPSVFNFYDLPAMSLPLPRAPGELPVGLMVVGRRGEDRALLGVAAALEALLTAG